MQIFKENAEKFKKRMRKYDSPAVKNEAVKQQSNKE